MNQSDLHDSNLCTETTLIELAETEAKYIWGLKTAINVRTVFRLFVTLFQEFLFPLRKKVQEAGLSSPAMGRGSQKGRSLRDLDTSILFSNIEHLLRILRSLLFEFF